MTHQNYKNQYLQVHIMIAKLDILCEQVLVHIVLTCYLHVQVRVLVGLPDISHTYLPTSRNKNKSAF